MVDDRASEMEPGIRELIAGTNHRNNLPWFPTRRWSGPPRELADDILARELVGLRGRRAAAARLRRPRARPLRRARPRRRGLPRPPRARSAPSAATTSCCRG